jgi:hypothetical protein
MPAADGARKLSHKGTDVNLFLVTSPHWECRLVDELWTEHLDEAAAE